MIRSLIVALALLSATTAFAQDQAPKPAPTPIVVTTPAPVVNVTPPVVNVPAAPTQGGVIDIGQALGPFLQPYVNAVVGSLLTALVSWVLLILKNKFNVQIDESNRNALVTALKNQAGSLIADGFVKVEANGKVTVPNQALAEAANEVMGVIPDAAARLGFTPDYVAKRIVDTIPQTAAGAQLVAAAAPANG